MKPFNLAEAKIAERNYCQTHMNRHIRMIVLFVGLVIIVGALSYGCNYMVTGRFAQTKAELANAQKRCAYIERGIESTKAELDQRQWQTQLARTSNHWLNVMDAITGSLPGNVWLTRIQTMPKESTISIEGRAASFDSLSAFMEGLHTKRYFSDIRLGSARTTRVANLTFIEFSLPIKLRITVSVPGSADQQADASLLMRRPRT